MLPILFQLGPVTIYSFGLLVALGFLLAMFLIFREAKKEYLDEEKVFDVVFLTIIGGLLGARLFYIIEHFDRFGFHFLNWLLVNARPGFSLWGGVGAGVAVFLLMCKKRKLPVYKLFDMVTAAIIISFIFGYSGAYLSGQEVGTPTNLPWGVIFFSTLKRHPVGLYQTIITIIVLLITLKLKKIYEKKRVPAGSLFFSFVIIESILAFPIAFLKEDVIFTGQFFNVDHFVYFVLLLVGSILLYRRLGRNLKNDLLFIKRRINEKISA